MKNIGETIDDFEFQKPDGTRVRPREYLGRPLVMIFLRHLA